MSSYITFFQRINRRTAITKALKPLRLLKVVNDILLNMDNQLVTLLRLLDLSAAFDTVDYGTLLQRLKNSFGIQGKVLSWFQSYLSARSQCISVHSALSRRFNLECGVPQGSCLGPLLFTPYTSK